MVVIENGFLIGSTNGASLESSEADLRRCVVISEHLCSLLSFRDPANSKSPRLKTEPSQLVVARGEVRKGRSGVHTPCSCPSSSVEVRALIRTAKLCPSDNRQCGDCVRHSECCNEIAKHCLSQRNKDIYSRNIRLCFVCHWSDCNPEEIDSSWATWNIQEVTRTMEMQRDISKSYSCWRIHWDCSLLD